MTNQQHSNQKTVCFAVTGVDLTYIIESLRIKYTLHDNEKRLRPKINGLIA